jgi:disease resistance protein RPM1
MVLDRVRNLCDDEPFGVLCKLPSLQSVRMEGPCYSGEELVARTSHNFPALVNLSLMFLGDTPQAYLFQSGSVPNLEKLTFGFGITTTSVVTGIEHMTKLKVVQFRGWKTGDAFNRLVEQFKAESGKREAGSSQFQVIVEKR